MTTSLTPRQTQILQLLAAGQDHQAIADRLHVDRITVTTTIRNARIRLGAASTADAVKAARRLGLIDTTGPEQR